MTDPSQSCATCKFWIGQYAKSVSSREYYPCGRFGGPMDSAATFGSDTCSGWESAAAYARRPTPEHTIQTHPTNLMLTKTTVEVLGPNGEVTACIVIDAARNAIVVYAGEMFSGAFYTMVKLP